LAAGYGTGLLHRRAIAARAGIAVIQFSGIWHYLLGWLSGRPAILGVIDLYLFGRAGNFVHQPGAGDGQSWRRYSRPTGFKGYPGTTSGQLDGAPALSGYMAGGRIQLVDTKSGGNHRIINRRVVWQKVNAGGKPHRTVQLTV